MFAYSKIQQVRQVNGYRPAGKILCAAVGQHSAGRREYRGAGRGLGEGSDGARVAGAHSLHGHD